MPPFRYYPPTVAGTGMKPGTLLLTEALEDLVGFDIGPSYNRRCVVQCGSPVPVGAAKCGNGHGISHHAECTAVDVMSIFPSVHRKVIDWCLGPAGQAYEVQEIVTGYPPVDVAIIGPARWTVDTGWKPYTGRNHRDHVHLSQTPHAASRTTPPEIPQEDDDMPAYPYKLIRSKGSWKTAKVPTSGDPAGIELIPGEPNPMIESPLAQGARAGLWDPAQAQMAVQNADTDIDITDTLWRGLTKTEPGEPR